MDGEFANILMEYLDCPSVSDYIHDRRYEVMNEGEYSAQSVVYTYGIIFWESLTRREPFHNYHAGIEYLHDYDPPIIHRDLKPQNLLLFENYKTLKIGDFGTVTEMKTKNTSNLGTESYQAPEVISSNGEYTEKCDIFSFGIILWEVMSRKKPSEYIGEGGRPELHVKIITECEQLQKLIESCWHSDPEKRPSAESIQLCTIPCSVTYID
ncbi:GH17233 [Drosophila grimshawi]|uniref:GH17233 n=1 Tax=Drosophila grimshawi TaxID=7222 RepID=B4JUD0_DROGR|nr:GH17233 [Drosophila grimshawi]